MQLMDVLPNGSAAFEELLKKLKVAAPFGLGPCPTISTRKNIWRNWSLFSSSLSLPERAVPAVSPTAQCHTQNFLKRSSKTNNEPQFPALLELTEQWAKDRLASVTLRINGEPALVADIDVSLSAWEQTA